jgi:Ser/Thr protein kinase RdoA (MazF antagonist)
MIPGRDDFAKRQLDIVLEAYDQMRTFDYRSLRLIEALRALRMIHFDGWIAKRFEDPAFPKAFPEFGTDKYWMEQVIQLEEQCALL